MLMNNINLKELKDALNEISDKNLEHFTATSKIRGFEDPECEVGVYFFGDESEFSNYSEKYDEPGMKIVSKFVKGVEDATREVIAAETDDNYFEYLTEQGYD